MYISCMYIHVTCMYSYLGVETMKAMFRHIKRITPGTHDTPAQLRLPFHTTKGSQCAINNMSLQYMIQLSRSPTSARFCPLISFVWKTQLILQVLPNPFCQFGWQPTQGRMCSPVYELQPFWRVKRSIR